MSEEEYIYVSNKTNLSRALDALRDCLPGYGYREEDDKVVRQILYRAQEACFAWLEGKVDPDDADNL